MVGGFVCHEHLQLLNIVPSCSTLQCPSIMRLIISLSLVPSPMCAPKKFLLAVCAACSPFRTAAQFLALFSVLHIGHLFLRTCGVGERERANLVVQLALYLSVCRHTVIILNTRQSEISLTPCLAHAQIYIASILRVTAGRFARCWL